MSELRQDPLHQRWVVIAPERNRRPPTGSVQDSAPRARHGAGDCPFCPGSEALTPPDIRRVESGSSWRIRVFPHREPALGVEGDLEAGSTGLYQYSHGLGAQELVVETPDHDRDWQALEPDEVAQVLATWQLRLRDLYRDGRLEQVTIFKGHGAAAGAPIDHAHSQLLATPFTPTTAKVAYERAIEVWKHARSCLICDLLRQALHDGERVVAADKHSACVTPYASRFPFELRLLPLRHSHDFCDASEAELASMARLLTDACRRLTLALDDPAYNLVLHTAPNPHPLRPHSYEAGLLQHAWHWHLDIFPRLLAPAGHEQATGLYVNPTPPEEAAAFLRGLA